MRKSTPDLVKGLAVIMMVQVHLTEVFAVASHSEGILGKLSLFMGGQAAAPVFMIIMGYFGMLSGRTAAMQLLRGVTLILLGLGLNILLNAHALIRIVMGTLALDPWKFIFGVDILPMAGLSIIVIALLRLIFKKHPLPFIVLLIAALILPFFDDYFMIQGSASFGIAFIAGNYSWSYFPLFPWLAYPLSGCLVYIAMEHKKVKTLFETQWLRLMLLSLVAVFATCWLAVPHIVTLPLYYHHTLLMYLWMIGFIIVWYWLLQKLDAISSSAWPLVYLRWLGKNVTVFYVFQWIIIGNLGTWLYHTQNKWQLVAWFVAITAVVSLLVMAWNHYLLYRNRDVVL
jgi:hypothetical protein